jgi:hypothetical protein
MSSSLGEIFGKAGEIFQPLIDSISSEVIGSRYTFLDLDKYDQLSPNERMRVYWTELLYRAHWAAASNVLRHKRWINACLALYDPNPNYIAFCAALRGLTEAAADASHSLGAVPLTLAQNYHPILEALTMKTKTISISKALEDMLIHFQFARKLKNHEKFPETHDAEHTTTYIKSIEPPNKPLIKPLYDDLCQVTHPAAQSVLWVSKASGDNVELSAGDDKIWIMELCRGFYKAIEWVQMQSVNTSILVLKVLNVFPVKEIKTEIVESINMDTIPLWHKIDHALKIAPRQG